MTCETARTLFVLTGSIVGHFEIEFEQPAIDTQLQFHLVLVKRANDITIDAAEHHDGTPILEFYGTTKTGYVVFRLAHMN